MHRARASILALGVFLSGSSSVTAQNRVLDLDGRDSCVELPSHIFNDLEEATIEGWVNCREYRTESRFFDFGTMGPGIYVTEDGTTPAIRFTIAESGGKAQTTIRLENVLRLGQWCHFAAVTGRGGMKFYVNGVLAGTNACTGSFREVKNGEHNYLGRNNWKGYFRAEDFSGQMDEVRVWRTARTREQIQANLFQRLSGNEEGLVGLWNFDDSTARDVSGGRHHGKLTGRAICVPGRIPSPAGWVRPALLYGKITDEKGQPVRGATVSVDENEERLTDVAVDATGEYQILLYPANGTFDVAATSGAKGDWHLQLRLQAEEWRRLDFVLTEASVLSGRVRTLDAGLAQPDVAVQALKPAGTGAGGRSPARVVETQWTGANGGFAFVNLKPGRYQLRCLGNGKFIDYGQGESLEVQLGKTLPGINFQFSSAKKANWKSYTLLDGLRNDDIHDLIFDSYGALWLATWGGLARYDGRSWSRVTKEDGLIDNRVNAIAQDSKGQLWLATESGPAWYDGNRWHRLTGADAPAGVRTGAILVDPEGRVWCGGPTGIFCYDGKSWQRTDRSRGLADNEVNCIYRDSQGVLWFGTMGGVSRYDGKVLRNLTIADGLPDNAVSAILQDSDGAMWFGTARGLSRYDGRAFLNFTSKDGLRPGAV